MTIISNSSTTNHGETFMALCQKADELLMVTPFCYSDFSDFAEALEVAGSIHRVQFITTLKKDEVVGKIDALLSFSKEMNRIKVQWELRIDNHLHGKIYIFKKDGDQFAGIITSANLTHNGMAANHEWGCVIEDEQMLAFIEKQVIDDAPIQLTESILEEIKERAKMKYPEGVKKEAQ